MAAVSTSTRAPAPESDTTPDRTWRLAGVAVAVVAFVARLGLVERAAGMRGNFGYDVTVYYSGADGLVHGRLPYRDFVFLHPPAIVLTLSPAALIGRLTNEHIGFAVANLGFQAIGALNALLVVAVARQFGRRLVPSVVAGLFYAVWLGSVASEFSARLEPLGNFFLLVGILVLARALREDEVRARSLLIGGAALGVAVSVKIWFAVPVVVLIAWIALRRRSLRPALFGAGGAAAAVVVLWGPFLALSSGRMWTMVISAQLGRPRMNVSQLERLGGITGVWFAHRHLSHGLQILVVAAALVLLAAVLVLAATAPGGRVVALLTLVQMAVLVAGPSWFFFYSDYAAVALALSVAAAGDARLGSGALRHLRGLGALALAGAAVCYVAVALSGSFKATVSWGSAGKLASRVASVRCISADSPGALIELKALDRAFANHCQQWVDVTGHTYLGRDKSTRSRTHNAPWQADVLAYLRSGNAVILVRPGTGLTPATLKAVKRDGALAHVHRFTVYRVTH